MPTIVKFVVLAALLAAGCIAPAAEPAARVSAVEVTATCFLVSGPPGDEASEIPLAGETYHVGPIADTKAALVLVTTGAGAMHYWDGEIPALGRANDTTLPRMLARAGYAVFAYDRMGTGESQYAGDDRTITLGVNARNAGEVVARVRAGSYAWGTNDCAGGPGPAFDRIALGGHSLGAVIAAEEAQEIGGIDGLLLMGYVGGANPAFIGAVLDCVREELAADPTREQMLLFCPDEAKGYSPECYQYTIYLPGSSEEIGQAFCKNGEIHPEPVGLLTEFFQTATRAAPVRPIGNIPMLVLIGDHDCLTNVGPDCDDRSEAEQALAQWKANCGCRFNSEWLPMMGHDFVVHHQYLEHNRAVLAWLDASFS